MNFTDAVRTVFTKYAEFKGTASRSEFWWWVLFVVVASIVLGAVSHMLSMLFSLATLVPGIAVTARRLHDTDRSGWWQLIALVPFVGLIVLIVFCVQESKPGTRFAGTAAA